jgi:hypothetical protein
MSLELDDDDGKVLRQSKHRSPNYPQLTLEEAVGKVRVLYTEDGKHGAPMQAALEHLGFSSMHGHARATLSALKKFGLIEDKGGRVAPTARAIDLLVFDPDQERHITALQEAALAPTLHRTLWDQSVAEERLPSDRSLRQQLITDHDFNPKTVDNFIRDFKSTLEFAGLLNGNKLVLSRGKVESTPETNAPSPEATLGAGNADMAAANTEARRGETGRSDGATPVNGWKIPLGINRDGAEIYANFQANHPLSRSLLRKLARHLDFMATEWGIVEEDDGQKPEH